VALLRRRLGFGVERHLSTGSPTLTDAVAAKEVA
jgi:hypothetical protein